MMCFLVFTGTIGRTCQNAHLHAIFRAAPTKISISAKEPVEVGLREDNERVHIYYTGHKATLKCVVDGAPEHLVEWVCEMINEQQSKRRSLIDCKAGLLQAAFISHVPFWTIFSSTLMNSREGGGVGELEEEEEGAN